MKLQVHLICLLGLLCFWEMVIQPGSNRHDTLQTKHELLNNLNTNQLSDYGNTLLTAIKKGSFDYPSLQADQYTARAANAVDCFEEARNKLMDVNANNFLAFVIENEVFFKQMTDSVESAAIPDVFMIKDQQPKLMTLDYPLVKNDFKVRLAMAALLTENYCASKIYGDCGFYKFYPAFFMSGVQYVAVHKKISIGAAVSAFSSRDIYLNTPWFPPLKNGIIELDTLLEKPGIYKIPLGYWFRNERSRVFTHGTDTLAFEVFPK